MTDTIASPDGLEAEAANVTAEPIVVDTALATPAAPAAPIVTDTVTAQPPVITPTPIEGIEPLRIEIRDRFGYRNVRGKPTRVPTGHLDIFVDGKMHAWTHQTSGHAIFALAEFLPHEIPQVVEAVANHTGQTRVFHVNNTPTQAEIDSLNKVR